MEQRLHDLTWKELEGYLKRRDNVILPIGAVEEHGYHLPLSTDGDIAQAIADEVGRRTGILVAPMVWYGICNSTRGYPGTISLSFDGLRSLVTDLVESLKETGFKEIFFLPGHLGGSHIQAIKEGGQAVERAKLYLLDYSKVSHADIFETAPFHACEAETSLMLHLFPEKVRFEYAVDEKVEFHKYTLNQGLKKTDSGVWGTPSKATKEKGELFFNAVIEEFAGFLSSIT